jgi:hypothetical protein
MESAWQVPESQANEENRSWGIFMPVLKDK